MKIPVYHILMSIKPEYAEAILRGEKTWEFRKNCTAMFCKKRIYIYETMPIGRVVGTVDVITTLCYKNIEFETFWNRVKDGAGIKKEQLRKYYGGRNMYAYQLRNPVRFETPLELKVLGVKKAPQSFCYLNHGNPVMEGDE